MAAHENAYGSSSEALSSVCARSRHDGGSLITSSSNVTTIDKLLDSELASIEREAPLEPDLWATLIAHLEQRRLTASRTGRTTARPDEVEWADDALPRHVDRTDCGH